MVDKTTNNKLLILKQYISNYLAQHHVRELAKLTKKSHVTLLPHLKSLEKDKVLISRKVGKNKLYSLNTENIAAKNYILITELAETSLFLEQVFLIKKIFSEISKLSLDGTLILFGSYAKKSFKEDSDIDILYIGNLNESELDEIKKIGKIYGKAINVKITNKNFGKAIRKKEPLIIEIIKNHVILQNADTFVNELWKYFNEIKSI